MNCSNCGAHLKSATCEYCDTFHRDSNAERGETAADKTEFDAVLISFGNSKIQVIKEVGDVTGRSLWEAKWLVERLPKPLKEGIGMEEAEAIKAKIEEAWGQVDINVS